MKANKTKTITLFILVLAAVWALTGCDTLTQSALTIAAVQSAPIKDVPAIRERAKQVEDAAGIVVDACDSRLGNEPVPLSTK